MAGENTESQDNFNNPAWQKLHSITTHKNIYGERRHIYKRRQAYKTHPEEVNRNLTAPQSHLEKDASETFYEGYSGLMTWGWVGKTAHQRILQWLPGDRALRL